jgi:hypothetical protein
MKRKRKHPEKNKPNEASSELVKLTRIIAVPIAIEQIEKLASSDERKKIWVLCSGKLTREQISSKSGVSLRTTTAFIDSAMTYGLLEEEKGKGGHPRRLIDYIPSDWKKLAKKKKQPEEKREKEKVSTETS